MSEFIPHEKGQNRSIQDVHHIQSLFNLITAKKQTISKKYYNRYTFYDHDITNLHAIITQTVSARHLLSINYSISVQYVDNSIETKTDISFFSNASLVNKQIMSIDLDYDFLISIPGVNDPQSYKLNISTRSTSAIKKNLQKRADLPSYMTNFMRTDTGKYHIDYVDQTVAREISFSIDEWFSQLKSVNHTRIKKIQDYTTYFGFVFKAVCIFSAFLYVRYYSGIFNNVKLSADYLVYRLFIYSLVFMLIVDLSERLGSVSERFADSISVDSMFKITACDIEIAETNRKQNRYLALKSVGGFFISIISNVVAGYLVYKFS